MKRTSSKIEFAATVFSFWKNQKSEIKISQFKFKIKITFFSSIKKTNNNIKKFSTSVHH
jgi:hypothetical protein